MLERLMQVFERLVTVLAVLVLLPCVLGAIVRSVGTVHLLLVLGILCIIAYLRQQSRPPSAGRRRGGSGAERSPLLPKGDD